MPRSPATSKNAGAALPPHSLPAEQAVLGGLVRDNAQLTIVQRTLSGPEEFYTDAHRRIYAAILALHGRGSPIDLVTLGDELHRRGDVEEIGGYGYLAQILDACPAAANTGYHATIVNDHYIRRNLMHLGTETLRLALQPTGPATELVATVSDKLAAAVNGHLAKGRRRGREELPAPVQPGQVRPFPMDCLPVKVRDYVTELSVAMKGPVDFAAVAALAAASIAIGTTRAVHLIHPWDEMCNLYIAIVAEPGSKKSPMQKQVMRPLRRIAKRLSRDADHALTEYEVSLEAWNDQRRRASHASSQVTIPPKPDKPPRKRVLTNRATTEVLARILYRNPRGIGLVHDELASLMRAMDQYKEGGKGDDRQFFLSAWSNASDTWDRVNLDGVPLELDMPFLTIIGGMPPDTLESMCGEQKQNDGFVDRFLFCWPHERPEPKWSWEELHPHSQDSWNEVIEALWSLPQGAGPDGPAPVVNLMTPEAREMWERRYNEHVAETESDSLPAVLKYPWQKMKQYALRLAVIVHWLRWASGEWGYHDNGLPAMPPDERYDDADIDCGWELVEYFKSHARRVHLRLKNSPNDSRCDRAYQYGLANGNEISLRKAMRTNLCGITTREDGIALFQAMESRGMGKMRRDVNVNGTISVILEIIPPE